MDYLKTRIELQRRAAADLNLNHPFVKETVWPVRNCWHFSSDGNFAEALFYDETDFRDAMNRIGTLCLRYPVLILAFCLMDNHFHFVLYGDFNSCNRFVHEYMRLTGWSLSLRHGKMDPVKDIPIDYSPISDETYLCRAICYDILNPTMAGLAWMFYDYPWSSGPLYFRGQGFWTAAGRTWGKERKEMICDMHVTDRRRRLKSTETYPEGWWVTDGIIFPGLYVEMNLVKSVFQSYKRFNYYISKHRKDDMDSEIAIISRIGIPDGELRIHRDEILKDRWEGAAIRSLSIDDRIKVASELKRRFGVSAKAVARIARIPSSDIEKVI